MSRDDRRAWLNAAYKAIGHYPLDILKAGAVVAMKEADHPSKIVPIITRTAEPMLSQRRSIDAIWQGADNSPHTLPAPGKERATKEELDAICRQHGVGRYASADAGGDRKREGPSADPDRQCRTPTRADYIRLGVAAEALDAMGITA